MNFKSRKSKVLLGVTGSVAAYKAVDLAARFRLFAEVRVVLTEAGSRLVPEKSLREASGFPVWKSLFKGSTPIRPGTPSGSHPLAVVPHIEYAKQADLVLIAPATADILAKLAFGIADDLLSTLCLYATCPLWVAPAMNSKMWAHPATRQNKKTLEARSVRFLGPESGHLACGEVGDGRFAEPAEIASQVESYFLNFQKWKGRKVLVTAGPTEEPVDPVRVLTNRSSGKMGYALAQAALNRGAEVTLVSGPVSIPAPSGVNLIRVRTAAEMGKAVFKKFSQADILVMAAAVADYAVSGVSKTKIKKKNRGLSLRLRPNPDILEEAILRKKPGQFVVGFAAETDHLRKNAEAKWKKKPCDLLVANRVGKGVAFGEDENELLVFSRFFPKPVFLGRESKSRLAEKVLDLIPE